MLFVRSVICRWLTNAAAVKQDLAIQEAAPCRKRAFRISADDRTRSSVAKNLIKSLKSTVFGSWIMNYLNDDLVRLSSLLVKYRIIRFVYQQSGSLAI